MTICLRKHANILNSFADGWRPYGFLGCVTRLADWGCPGCARWVVLVDHCPGTVFIEECSSWREAEAVRQAVARKLDRRFRRRA